MNIIPIEGAKKPLFSWCPDLEKNAMDQMEAIAKLPFIEHVAIMPDGHLGQNMCIGGVVACNGVVVPDFIGSDAGCGVCAVKTNLKREDILDRGLRKRILDSILRGVPVGFQHNSQKRQREIEQKYSNKAEYIISKSGIENVSLTPLKKDSERETIYSQIGTLGGGNHMIEIDYDENDNVWFMVHSGSRNIGMKINDYFNDLAQKSNEMWYSQSSIPFLPATSEEGKALLSWMEFALRFAFLNRQVIIDEIQKNVEHIMDISLGMSEFINIHHNYASLENHFGKNLWVHRKGATLAVQGQFGIIPGSMGTATFIVEGIGDKNGKGNPNSLYSCSHGAGRTMGRAEFNRTHNTQDLVEKIKEIMKDVVYVDFSKEITRKGNETGNLDLSECPLAYKSIEQVMSNQTDLVKPIHKLMPMINIKA